MTLYAAALFLHVVGALLLFAALTLEGIALRQVRRAANLERVRDSAAIAGLTRQVGPASAVGILLPGLYMTATTWGFIPWIVTGLVAWLFVGVLGAVNGIRLGSLGRAAASQGERFSTELVARVRDPLLIASWRVRVAIVLGIVFLMTGKPGMWESVLVVLVAVLVGLVSSLPAWRAAAYRPVIPERRS
jgi:hypothetical protein